MALLKILKPKFLLFEILIDLILWVIFSTFFGIMVADFCCCCRFTTAAIAAIVFATLTTLTMLGLEVYGTNKKHIESMIASIVIHCIRLWIFICISVASGYPYHHYGWSYEVTNQPLLAIAIILILWDFLRIISEFKIISLIKKRKNEDNASAIETATKFNDESLLESIKTLGGMHSQPRNQ